MKYLIILIFLLTTEVYAQDMDNDTVLDPVDNCPSIYNPGQDNLDNDTRGDACDDDTIYGYISGEVVEGITVRIEMLRCAMLGGDVTLGNLLTNKSGYYSFIMPKENKVYRVTPMDLDVPPKYIFYPSEKYVKSLNFEENK